MDLSAVARSWWNWDLIKNTLSRPDMRSSKLRRREEMIMKTQGFGDQTLSSDALKAWKASLTDLGAQFIAKKRYGMNAVRLEGCKVTFTRPEELITERSKRPAFDLDAHWRTILGVCQEFGFKPK
jgi:hypothetical protein